MSDVGALGMQQMQNDLADIITYKHDVFLVFATEDEDLAKNIFTRLQGQNLKCLAQFEPDAFQHGQNVVDNIVYNIKNSKTTLLLMTSNSFKAKWVTLETVLALEESQRRNELRLRMLVNNVRESELESFNKGGLLAAVPYIKLDLNKDDWVQCLMDQLRAYVDMPAIPLGNMAHGLVFSHYVGFLSHVLPVLKEEISKSQICQLKPRQVSRKYFMLLPSSCGIRDDLSGCDEESGITITCEETFEFQKEYVGKPRTYKITIYKITNGEEEFYFFADFPNVLKAMSTVKQKKLADIDIRLQIARFYYTINEVINHAENKDCHGTVHLILFNDAVESVQEVLWQAVSEDVQESQQNASQAQLQSTDRLTNQSQPDDNFLDATITCDENSEEDNVIAEKIEKYLNKKGKNVQMNQSQFALKVDHARWHIFVLSEEALNNDKTLSMKCNSALVDNMNDDSDFIRVLVVVNEIDPRKVPRSIRCVNMLKASEPNFTKQILQCMNGGALRMEHQLPCGDVATGLAWAYVINYLRIPLLYSSETQLDLPGRIKKCLQDNGLRYGCILKLFIVLPKSCRCGVQFPMEKIGTLEKVVINSGGQLNRPFLLHMYQHTDTETHRTVCFLAEFCTPANTMRAMVDNHKFSGLSEEEMSKQCEDFTKTLRDIISRDAVKKQLGDISNLVEVVEFDDKEESFESAIARHVQDSRHEMVYGMEVPIMGNPDLQLPSIVNR